MGQEVLIISQTREGGEETGDGVGEKLKKHLKDFPLHKFIKLTESRHMQREHKQPRIFMLCMLATFLNIAPQGKDYLFLEADPELVQNEYLFR